MSSFEESPISLHQVIVTNIGRNFRQRIRFRTNEPVKVISQRKSIHIFFAFVFVFPSYEITVEIVVKPVYIQVEKVAINQLKQRNTYVFIRFYEMEFIIHFFQFSIMRVDDQKFCQNFFSSSIFHGVHLFSSRH